MAEEEVAQEDVPQENKTLAPEQIQAGATPDDPEPEGGGGAVSGDPAADDAAAGEEQPEQTDNSVKDDDGDQDVNQETDPAEGSV